MYKILYVRSWHNADFFGCARDIPCIWCLYQVEFNINKNGIMKIAIIQNPHVYRGFKIFTGKTQKEVKIALPRIYKSGG